MFLYTEPFGKNVALPQGSNDCANAFLCQLCRALLQCATVNPFLNWYLRILSAAWEIYKGH